MQSLFHSLQQTAQDPTRLHAAIVHLPIAAAALGLVLLLLLTLVGARSPGLRWAAVVVYLAGAVTGAMAMCSGEQAQDHVAAAGVTLTAEAADLLHEHEELGEKVWIPLAIATVLIVLTSIRMVAARVAALTLAILSGLAALGMVVATAHYGGQLVYLHGVGVPQTDNNMPAVVAPAAPAPRATGKKPPPHTAPVDEDDGDTTAHESE